MDSTYFWICIALMSIGTFAIRYSVIAMSDRLEISDRHRELFSFIPAAIFPALTVPMVFFHQGQVDWLLRKERLLVLILALLVSLVLRSMVVTLVFGLFALYLLTSI